jgi:hypothetical protein
MESLSCGVLGGSSAKSKPVQSGVLALLLSLTLQACDLELDQGNFLMYCDCNAL